MIEICQFPYTVYYAFLKYLYTEKVDDLSIDNVISKCASSVASYPGLLILAFVACSTNAGKAW